MDRRLNVKNSPVYTGLLIHKAGKKLWVGVALINSLLLYRASSSLRATDDR